MLDFKSKLKVFGKLMVSDPNESAIHEKIVLNYLISDRCITIDFMKAKTSLSEDAILSVFENLDQKELFEYDRQLRCLRISKFKIHPCRKPILTMAE